MPILSTIAAKSAATATTSLVKWGYKKLTGKKVSGFETELHRIIIASIGEYEQKYPIPETNRIPFYNSQGFFDLLLEFRFTKQIDQTQIEKLLKDNPLIIPPTDAQLATFFTLFDAKIAASKNLAQLNIDANFKEEIFHISEMLRGYQDEMATSILELKQEIRSSDRNAVLIEEWNKQIDEIYQYVANFKPITALDRLAHLETRITSEGIGNDKLLARISYIHALCLIQCEEHSKRAEVAEYLIRAYKLQPQHAEYKANAGLAYATIGEVDKGLEIARSILSTDEFDPSAWLIQILSAKKDFGEVLATTPTAVKAKPNFQLRLYHWLNTNHYIEKTSFLQFFEVTPQIDYHEPIVVTSQNLRIWLIKALYLLNTYYEKNDYVTAQLYDSKAKNDSGLQRAVKILSAMHGVLQGTELEACLANYWFEWSVGDFLLSADRKNIDAMEKWFPRVKPRQAITVIRMYQAYNSLGTREGVIKACRLLEEEDLYQQEPELHYFNALSYASLRDYPNAEKHFLQYVHGRIPIPWQSMVNILLFLRKSTITISESGINNLKTLLIEGTFEFPIHRELLSLALYFRFQSGLTDEEVRPRVEHVAANLDPADLDLYLTVVYCWCMVEEFQKAKEYLENRVSLTEESEALKLYCKVLFSIDGFKPKLLELLRYWRQHFHPDAELAEIELYLFELGRSWEELAAVAQWAITQWPDSEKAIFLLFKAFQNSLNVEGIVANAPLVRGRLFKQTAIVPSIYQALCKASLYAEALEFLYQHARNRENVDCRQAYLTSTIIIPEGHFVDFPEVAVGRYVAYQIGTNKAILEVTTSNQQSFPANYLLGKKPGETFSIPLPLTNALEQVTILRVCNHYLALFQEILFDTENPLSGLGVHAFRLDESTAENLSQKLIASFGATGTLESDRLKIELEKYYLGQISFSEITNSVFRRHPIDAYFALSDKSAKAFKAISPAISKSVVLQPDDRLILDFTTLCLFYELTQNLAIEFSKKFVVSQYTREVLAGLLQDAKDSPQAEYSISITQEKVTPHFYAKNFKENRVKLISSILEWVNVRCEVQQSEETLDFIVASKKEGEIDTYLLVLLENRLLAGRPNCFLLSNDTMYYRYMNIGPDKCISPLCYLSGYPTPELDRILDFMLEKNYIGIPISNDVLTRELFKMLSDQPNKFTTCIENLRSNWNPDPHNVTESVRFVKYLYTSSVLVPATRQHIVSLVFSSIVVGLSPNFRHLIRALLTTEFKMMGAYRDEVLTLYQLAVAGQNGPGE